MLSPIASRETGFYVRAAYDLMRIGHFYKAKSFEQQHSEEKPNYCVHETLGWKGYVLTIGACEPEPGLAPTLIQAGFSLGCETRDVGLFARGENFN